MTVTSNTETGAATTSGPTNTFRWPAVQPQLKVVEIECDLPNDPTVETVSAPQRTIGPPSTPVTLFVSALTLSIVIVAGLVIWAAIANPGRYPFSP
jgi:hypothetical protein